MGRHEILRSLYVLTATLATLASIAAVIVALARRPRPATAYFLCFIAIGAIRSIAAAAADLLAAGAILPLDVRAFWGFVRAAGRARWIFLALFVHSTRKWRRAPAALAALSAVLAAAILLSALVYTVIPDIAEALAAAYCFAYAVAAFIVSRRSDDSEDDRGLPGAALFAAAALFAGELFGSIGNLASAGPAISVLGARARVLSEPIAGAAVAWRALRDAFRARLPKEAESLPGDSIDSSRFAGLSARECEIVSLVLEGRTNKEVAERLFISESTVKKHVNHVFRKLGVGSRWALLRLKG